MAKKKATARKVDILEALREVLEEMPMAVGMRTMIIDKVRERLEEKA